jgi:hypothetical protein
LKEMEFKWFYCFVFLRDRDSGNIVKIPRIQGVSGGIVNILGSGSMDYTE